MDKPKVSVYWTIPGSCNDAECPKFGQVHDCVNHPHTAKAVGYFTVDNHMIVHVCERCLFEIESNHRFDLLEPELTWDDLDSDSQGLLEQDKPDPEDKPDPAEEARDFTGYILVMLGEMRNGLLGQPVVYGIRKLDYVESLDHGCEGCGVDGLHGAPMYMVYALHTIDGFGDSLVHCQSCVNAMWETRHDDRTGPTCKPEDWHHTSYMYSPEYGSNE